MFEETHFGWMIEYTYIKKGMVAYISFCLYMQQQQKSPNEQFCTGILMQQEQQFGTPWLKFVYKSTF